MVNLPIRFKANTHATNSSNSLNPLGTQNKDTGAEFICHTIITKNIRKEEEKKKKWRGDLTETIGAYERLGLLEL